MAGGPRRYRPAVGAEDGVVGEQTAELMRDDLRLERHVVTRAAVLQQLAPFLHPLLRGLEEFPVGLPPQQRQQRLQRRARIASEPELPRIAEPETTGIAVDLHGACLTRLGIELHVRKARSHDEKRVAFLERELGRQRAEQSDPPRRERRVIGDDGFAEQRLYDGSAQQVRGALELGGGAERGLAWEDDWFLSGIQHYSGALQLGRRRHGDGR